MNLLRGLSAALVVVVLLGASSVRAIDCGDTSGPGGVDVPCSCGDTVTTSTKLGPSDPVISTGPKDICPTGAAHGLTAAAGVDLDIDGNAIRAGSSTQAGIGAFGVSIAGSGVTVRNGTISNFISGIGSITPVDHLTILNVEISDGSAGIFIVGGDGHLIQANRVNLTGLGGFAGIAITGRRIRRFSGTS